MFTYNFIIYISFNFNKDANIITGENFYNVSKIQINTNFKIYYYFYDILLIPDELIIVFLMLGYICIFRGIILIKNKGERK